MTPSVSTRPLAALRQQRGQALLQLRAACDHAAAGERLDVLVGEVDGRLHLHPQRGEPLDQRVDGVRELAPERAQRGARTGRRGRVDEVDHRLRLRQIEPPVEEGALGNSPARARRQPSATARCTRVLSTTAPPWPCSSSMGSPV
ncbi:MAG: hypothetical protein U1F30_03905 [Steroidobacteraceae bacterium]